MLILNNFLRYIIMARKTKNGRRPQKLYRMKGCSKTMRKKQSGGENGSGDVYLAYPANNVHFLSNSNLAYTGKGGACGLNAPPMSTIPTNTNAADRAMPNTGPPANGFNFLNPTQPLRGGGCSSCERPLMSGGCGEMCSMKGGKRKMKTRARTRAIAMARGRARANTGGCGPACALPFLGGGKKRQQGGNPGIPYPDGLVGSPWTPSISGWPGVDGVQGDRNYLSLNTYNNDISRQMVDVGPNPPFVVGGGKRARGRTQKQRGGTMSNFLTQDLVNLGRQVQFGVGSAYNALSGYSAPVNPLPWKDQYKQV
jgi:hypothetical protein